MKTIASIHLLGSDFFAIEIGIGIGIDLLRILPNAGNVPFAHPGASSVFDFDPDFDSDLDFDAPPDLIDTLQNIQYLACTMPRNVQPHCL